MSTSFSLWRSRILISEYAAIVVNFGTTLKVRDMASACPVAGPNFVRFCISCWLFFLFSYAGDSSGVQVAFCRLSPRPRRSRRGKATPTRPQALPCSTPSGRPPPSPCPLPRPRRCRSAGITVVNGRTWHSARLLSITFCSQRKAISLKKWFLCHLRSYAFPRIASPHQ